MKPDTLLRGRDKLHGTSGCKTLFLDEDIIRERKLHREGDGGLRSIPANVADSKPSTFTPSSSRLLLAPSKSSPLHQKSKGHKVVSSRLPCPLVSMLSYVEVKVPIIFQSGQEAPKRGTAEISQARTSGH